MWIIVHIDKDGMPSIKTTVKDIQTAWSLFKNYVGDLAGCAPFLAMSLLQYEDIAAPVVGQDDSYHLLYTP